MWDIFKTKISAPQAAEDYLWETNGLALACLDTFREGLELMLTASYPTLSRQREESPPLPPPATPGDPTKRLPSFRTSSLARSPRPSPGS